MKLASLPVLIALLTGCAATPAAIRPPSDSGLAHLATDGAYVTQVLFPDGGSALPPKPPGDLDPLVALTNLDIRPGQYTIMAGCMGIKDGGVLSVVVHLVAGQRYILRCAKDPLRLVVGA
ncbi:hypothetical protein J2X06_001259 [Lysobacter niastensis]|uniref:Lipoprotein n=1 Tax=Lysobacter niastensis TaxID=380629 RepID=A0ABU1W916_9GAMM|nr:hypothetical protein [Lysobacter niastensis]MDR7134075.1 hypothetical protein [Lysobacter niastensis]